MPVNNLLPQDIYVLLALVATRESSKEWTYERLSQELGLSSSQVFRSLQRAEGSHLFNKETRRIRMLELQEFLHHGIRYAFAAIPGNIQRGVSTGWDAPGLKEMMSVNSDESFVWPDPKGSMRGQGITPLHPGVLTAIGENQTLYQLLALTDILRIGSARERKVAFEELTRLMQ